MRLAQSLLGRAALVIAAAGVVGVASITIPSASAEESAAPAVGVAGGQVAATATAMKAQLAATLATESSTTTAGAYQDAASGQIVVNVTTEAAARTVRSSGVTARMVKRSSATLKATEAQLNRTANIPGTSWVIDPVTNQVVVSVDSSVTGAKLARLQRAVARLGGTVRVERVAGTFGTRITGGDAIFSGRSRCSLGFNVRRGNQRYFLTAGHCTRAGARWFADRNGRQVLGQAVSSSFPRNDYALVRYTAQNVNRPGGVNLYNGRGRDIVRAANAVVGQNVERSGSTTGLHRGRVTGLNATVNYSGGGQVTGLIRTSVCAEPGDSGGALVSGNIALGLTSGGSGDCRSGGVTFFQPVTEALNVFNVQIY